MAHHCFWELHPAKAYAWELRLKDEIKPEFTIDEPGSDKARARFLKEHAAEARAIEANEQKRRERKAAKADDDSDGPLFEQGEEESDGEAEAKRETGKGGGAKAEKAAKGKAETAAGKTAKSKARPETGKTPKRSAGRKARGTRGEG